MSHDLQKKPEKPDAVIHIEEELKRLGQEFDELAMQRQTAKEEQALYLQHNPYHQVRLGRGILWRQGRPFLVVLACFCLGVSALIGLLTYAMYSAGASPLYVLSFGIVACGVLGGSGLSFYGAWTYPEGLIESREEAIQSFIELWDKDGVLYDRQDAVVKQQRLLVAQLDEQYKGSVELITGWEGGEMSLEHRKDEHTS